MYKSAGPCTKICKGQLASVLVPTAIIMEWRKENRCFLSIHKAFNFSMYSDLSLFLLFLCIYQSFLSTYKDIIGKLSIHHIMFFAYGSSKRKWKPFLLLLSLHQQKKEHRRRRKKQKKKFLLLYCSFDMILIIEFLGKINLTPSIILFLEIISSSIA